MSDDHQSDSASSEPLAVVIRQTDLPSTLKGHAQRVIIRWLAGTIAHPYFSTVRDNLDTIEGRSRVNMMLAEEVGRQAVADPVQMERAKARFLGDLHRKQENVEAIAAATAAKVETQAETAVEERPAEEPSADWMNAFTHAAENASSEQLREHLASILAGEIKRPGTFSRSVLRLVGELEQDALLKFQQVLQHLVGRTVFIPETWQSGDMLLVGLELSELGLLSGVGTTNHQFKLDTRNNAFIIGSDYGGIVNFESHVSGLSRGIWVISRVGSELLRLLPAADERVALRALFSEIDKSNVRQIVIGRVTPAGNEMVTVSKDEVSYINSSTSPAHPVPRSDLVTVRLPEISDGVASP